ncbi:MAG: FecR family protein [Gallionella sp.]|nr:FecR family protein [Gallionella sp.]
MKTVNKFLATLGLVAACWMAASASAYAGVAGHIQFVSGNVQIISPTGQTRMAQKGDAVNEGDTLTSASRSTAQIKMQDGGFFAVRPETRMKIDKFAFSGKVDGSERGFFSLVKGGFRAVSGLIGRVNKQNYKVTTPSATIGIRGTDYEVVVAEEKVNLAMADLSWMISQTDAPPPVGLTIFSAVIVNGGMIQMKTNLGEVLLKPGQGMAISYGMDKQPKIVPVDLKLFPGAGNGQNGNKNGGGSGGKGGDSGGDGGDSGGNGGDSGGDGGDSGGNGGDSGGNGGDSGGNGGDSGGTGGDSGGTGGTTGGTGGTTGGTGGTTGGTGGTTGGTGGTTGGNALLTGANVLVVVQPPPPPPTACVGTTCVNLTQPTVDYAVQATALATQVGTAAAAAANAAAAVAQASATLVNIATVPVSPATAAISTATTDISTTSSLVTTAAALAPANATAVAANASAAQTAAATAAAQAAAAQAALNAHSPFADSTAGPANTAVQSANGTLQTANTAVQGAVATVTAQNTALAAAQGAAGTALASANTALSTANAQLTTANTQNTVIVNAQSLAAAQLTPAQTAAANAQAAANAAQAAATQAATLQAAGNVAGAQAQLVIVQQQLAIALLELGTAQSAQTTVTSQLASAQAAQTAAGAAVTAATSAATGASTAAAAASTQAAAAQTAVSAATSAVALSSTNLAAVNTQASTVATNAPIAAYNNPAVVTPDRFVGMMSTVKADAGGGFIEGYGPGAGFTTGTANTSFVLDGAGNLVESRHAWYEETAASTATPQVVMIDANVKRTGGTAVETFMMPDSSIYAGRWVGGTITVTDNNATPLPTISRNLGVTSEHWAILLAPPAGYVQTLSGSVAYNKVAATSPTDALGNAGTLNTASLTANFTTQLVNAALTLTIAGKTLDVVASSMAITGAHFSTGTQATATCTGCVGTYYANVGGGFAGNSAVNAGLNYTLWTGAAPGATSGATDLIQGVAAFSSASAPLVAGTNPLSGPFYAHEVVAAVGTAAPYTIANPWGSDLPNTSYGLDGTSNLVWVNDGVQVDSYSGGVAQNTWVAPDSSIYMGRWQGGSISTTDTVGVPISTTALGAGSAHWIVSAQIPTGYAQTLAGVASYALTAATSPTDASGNVGTLLSTSSITADFSTQLVNIALDVQFTGAQTKSFAVRTPGGIAIPSDAIWGVGTVTCTGASCDAGGYDADLWGRFAGSTASRVALAYHIVALNLADVVQGAAAFDSAGVVQVLPYVATNNAVAYTGSYGGSFSFIAAPGDSGPTFFRDYYGDGFGFRSDTLNGAANPMPGGTWTIANGTQQITYGGWGSISSITSSEQFVMMPTGGGNNTLPGYMYGEQGYLDANYWNYLSGTAMGTLANTFSYTQVAATSFDSDTWTSGSVSSATMSANFTAQTVTVALAGTMGANNWALNSGAMSITMPNPSGLNAAGARFASMAPTVTMNGGACPTCGGNVEGAFVGQNYAGAIVSYGVWDNSPILGMNAEGMVGFARQGAVTDGTPAPTGVTVVANSWQIQDSTNPVTVDGTGVLTGWSGSGYSATVSPATGSVAQTAVGSGSGTINWGTWASGSLATSTFTYMPGTGQFHWITAPEPTPIYLAEVLTTTVPYSLQGGAVTSLAGGGVTGTVSGTTAVTANFTTQSVAVNVALAVNGHNWVASTPDAPLYFLNNNSMTGFSADSRRLSWESGYLTVTVDGVAANGSLAGQLVGEALGGAILKFNLDGQGTTGGYDFVQGVAALAASTPNDPATSYRMIAVSMSDPMALAPTVMVGGSYNNAARVVTDVSGNLTQFDMNSQGGGNKGGGVTIQHVSGTFADQGSAVIGGSSVSWGRWASGTVVALTDRVTGLTQNMTLPSGAHAVLGPLMTGPVELPVAGVFGYTLVGNTTPTTDTGATGTLNAANTYLQANFSAQTVNLGVNVTAAGATLNAAATSLPIQNRAMFFTDSMRTGPGALAVTCTGTCGTTNHAAIGGAFGGAGGMGAAVTYGFQKQGVNAGTVSGVAVFQQGAAIPQ